MRNIPSTIFILFLIINPSINYDDEMPKPFIKPIYTLFSTQNISFKYYAYRCLYIMYDLTSFKKSAENQNELLYFYIKTSVVTFPKPNYIMYRLSNQPCDQIKEYQDKEFMKNNWKNANVVFKNEPIEKPYLLNHYIIEVDPDYENKEYNTLIIEFYVGDKNEGNLFIYRTENPFFKEKKIKNKVQEENINQKFNDEPHKIVEH